MKCPLCFGLGKYLGQPCTNCNTVGVIPDMMQPLGLATRHNNGKPKLSLVLEARDGLAEAARVMEFGMKKYSRGNWKKGLPLTEIIDSMSRHTAAFLSGEDVDPDSGCKHVGHILVNALFLADMYFTHPEMDDRSVEVKKNET